MIKAGEPASASFHLYPLFPCHLLILSPSLPIFPPPSLIIPQIPTSPGLQFSRNSIGLRPTITAARDELSEHAVLRDCHQPHFTGESKHLPEVVRSVSGGAGVQTWALKLTEEKQTQGNLSGCHSAWPRALLTLAVPSQGRRPGYVPPLLPVLLFLQISDSGRHGSTAPPDRGHGQVLVKVLACSPLGRRSVGASPSCPASGPFRQHLSPTGKCALLILVHRGPPSPPPITVPC